MRKALRSDLVGAAAIGAFSALAVVSLILVFLRPVIANYLRLSREAPCVQDGGWWNDAQRRCYFLDCTGRVGEQPVTPQPEMKCFVAVPP